MKVVEGWRREEDKARPDPSQPGPGEHPEEAGPGAVLVLGLEHLLDLPLTKFAVPL